MTSAGYSGRSAADKLGVRHDTRLGLVDAPDGWVVPGVPESVQIRRDLRGRRDMTLVFVRAARDLARSAQRYERALADEAALWIAWPRKAGGHDSDVTENLLRDLFLPLGLVDVKVAAIDEDWSGLKFVRRKELRAGPASARGG